MAAGLILMFGLTKGQKSIKFGQLGENDLNLEFCEFEPEASAMILGDYATLSFRLLSDDRWQYVFEHIRRIKVFDNSAIDEGDIKISLYQPSDDYEESISNIKAASYNTEEGKTVKRLLKKSDISEERQNEFWNSVKFTIPDVREGSVIEYSYRVTSDYLNSLRPWHFQDNLPVRFSEIKVVVPEYFNYRTIFKGTPQLVINEEKYVSETFSKSSSRYISNSPHKGRDRSVLSSYNSNSKSYRWVAQNLLSLKREPFTTTMEDYSFQVHFQLLTMNWSYVDFDNTTGTYEYFNNKLLNSSSHGKVLDNQPVAKKIISEIPVSLNEKEKLKLIYKYVRDYMTWNGIYSIWARNGLESAFANKKGTIGHINFLLISALREAGYEAYPIVLSTRFNGKMHPVYASLELMNYVVAGIKDGNELLIADASRKYLDLNLLPIECLNGHGWMVSDTGGQWVDLNKIDSYQVRTMHSWNWRGDSIVTEFRDSKKAYAALTAIEEINSRGKDKYMSEVAEKFAEWNELKKSITFSDSSEPVYMEQKSTRVFDGKELSIEPVIGTSLKENPFKNAERRHPVDIPYESRINYIFQFKKPDNFLISKIPNAAIFSLPEDGGYFRYLVSNSNDIVSINIQFSLNRTYFPVNDYPQIRDFYDMIEKKVKEEIVLTRKI